MLMIDDYDAIVKVIQLYIDGAGKGDIKLMRRAFHPEARLFGEADGERYDIGMEEYFKLSAESPLNNGGRYRARIVSVEQFGPAAAVVLAEDGCWGAVSFVDVFSLNRITDGWKIVNKTFAHTGGAIPGD
jgi:hypothetical protein